MFDSLQRKANEFDYVPILITTRLATSDYSPQSPQLATHLPKTSNSSLRASLRFTSSTSCMDLSVCEIRTRGRASNDRHDLHGLDRSLQENVSRFSSCKAMIPVDLAGGRISTSEEHQQRSIEPTHRQDNPPMGMKPTQYVRRPNNQGQACPLFAHFKSARYKSN
jgi:hypothetical protein